MERWNARLDKQMMLLGVAVTLVLIVGAILWITSPREGDKYGELGVNLIFGAGLTYGAIGVERLFASRDKIRQQAEDEHRARQEKAEAERANAAIEAQKVTESVLRQNDNDLSDVKILRGRDLSNLIMSRKKFDRADLSGTTLNRSELGGASLVQTNLEQASAFDANFTDTDLRKLQGKHFTAEQSSFDRANCSEADWSHARFTDCQMQGAEFIRATLDATDFSGSSLQKANFGKAEGTGAVFVRADLRAAKFEGTRLTRPDFSGANLHGAVFTGAVIEEPILTGADLRDCTGMATAFKNPITD